MPNRTAEILIIILFNFVPIVGVAYYNWTPFEVFWLFWVETLIIGFFNTVKVLYSQGLEQTTMSGSKELELNYGSAIRYLVARIFIFLFYSVFIIVFIGVMGANTKQGVSALAVVFFGNKLFNLALLITVLSQSFYLVKYFFWNRAFYFSKTSDYSALFDARQIVIHVAVVLGAVGSSFLFKEGDSRNSIWVIAVFCVVKCLVEIYLASTKKTILVKAD